MPSVNYIGLIINALIALRDKRGGPSVTAAFNAAKQVNENIVRKAFGKNCVRLIEQGVITKGKTD
jgi:hypothetical protein